MWFPSLGLGLREGEYYSPTASGTLSCWRTPSQIQNIGEARREYIGDCSQCESVSNMAGQSTKNPVCFPAASKANKSFPTFHLHSFARGTETFCNSPKGPEGAAVDPQFDRDQSLLLSDGHR